MGLQQISLLALALATTTQADTPDFSLIKSLGEEKLSAILEAHAVLGSLAWSVLIPFGAIAFAVLKIPRLYWIHSFIQTIGLLCLIPSFVLGVIIGIAYGKLYNNVHTIMGTVLFAVALFQPIWGVLQHRVYVKTGKKSWWALLHRWVGRITITVGVINGGLGFILTKGYPSYSHDGLVAYIVVSSVIWAIYVGAVLFETIRDPSWKDDYKMRSGSSTEEVDANFENKKGEPGYGA